MDKEPVSVKLRNTLQSSKESVSKGYHNFADFIHKTYTARKEMGDNKTLKMVIAKYVLVFLNICYMLMSLVMINIGTIGGIIQSKFHFWYEFDLLYIYWIATGVILLFVSIFGLIGAFKESTIWTNIFGVLMTIVFVIQISSAIVSFQFIGKSHMIAKNGIDDLMSRSSYSPSKQQRMDWIQKNFQCCGNDGPSDWNRFSKFERTTESTATNFNYYNHRYETTPTTTTSTPSAPLPDRMPSSCCIEDSNYNNLTCDKFYPTGCSMHIREVISESVMIIGSVALAIAVFEILGIFFAFVVAKIMRKTKSFVAIQQYDALATVPNNSETPAAEKAVEDVVTI